MLSRFVFVFVIVCCVVDPISGDNTANSDGLLAPEGKPLAEHTIQAHAACRHIMQQTSL